MGTRSEQMGSTKGSAPTTVLLDRRINDCRREQYLEFGIAVILGTPREPAVPCCERETTCARRQTRRLQVEDGPSATPKSLVIAEVTVRVPASSEVTVHSRAPRPSGRIDHDALILPAT